MSDYFAGIVTHEGPDTNRWAVWNPDRTFLAACNSKADAVLVSTLLNNEYGLRADLDQERENHLRTIDQRDEAQVKTGVLEKELYSMTTSRNHWRESYQELSKVVETLITQK